MQHLGTPSTPMNGCGGVDSRCEQPSARGCNHHRVTKSAVLSLGSTRHGPMGVLPPPPPGSTKLNQAGEGDGFPRRSTKRSAGCLCISASFSGRSRCVLRLASRVNTNCGEFASADRRPPPASRQGINCKAGRAEVSKQRLRVSARHFLFESCSRQAG